MTLGYTYVSPLYKDFSVSQQYTQYTVSVYAYMAFQWCRLCCKHKQSAYR